MASFEVKGTVEHVGAIEQVSDSFRKRDLILNIDEESDYPQTIKIEAAQAKCDDTNLNEVRKGDSVTVSVNLRGRVWDNVAKNRKEVFNTLQYWKLSINQTVAAAGKPQANMTYSAPAPVDTTQDDSDGLPF